MFKMMMGQPTVLRPGRLMKKEYKISDLTKFELDLLVKASRLPTKHFLCFGKHYQKLSILNLVDHEYNLTNEGLTMAKAWERYQGEERSDEKAEN